MVTVNLFLLVLNCLLNLDSTLFSVIRRDFNCSESIEVIANPPDRISTVDDDDRPCSSLFLLRRCTLVTLDGPPFRSTCSTSLHRVTWLLSLMAGVEANPDPYWNQLRLGVFNARGAAKKSADLVDLMFDNKLDVMAVSGT